MKVAPIPCNEIDRIRAVRSLRINSANVKEQLERITRITQSVFNVSCTYISLVSSKKVKILANQNSSLKSVSRDISFCGHTIGNKVTSNLDSRILEVKNALNDIRFHDNPLVNSSPSVHYYIGYVLQSLDKQNVGTLCMIDSRPRNLTSIEKQIFSELGAIAETEINKNARLVNSESKAKAIISEIEEENTIYDYVNKLCGISDAANELLAIMDKHLRLQGINLKEWRVLNEIIRSKQVTPTFVSAKTNIRPPMVSRLLESLESKLLIERIYSSKEDRRKVSLSCTDKGRDLWKYGKSYAATLQGSIKRVSKTLLK